MMSEMAEVKNIIWLSECIDTENPMTRASVVNVRVNSYATYDSKKGIK